MNDFFQVSPFWRNYYQPAPGPINGLKQVCSDISNRPPTVSVGTGSIEYSSPAQIRITASLFDCDANVVATMFYESSNVLAVVNTEMTNEYQSVGFVWSNVAAGTYVLSAAAVDEFGARATSDPVTISVYLITNGITEVQLTTNALDLASALLAWDCGAIQVRQVTASGREREGAMSMGVFQTEPPFTYGYGLAGPGVIISTGNVADYRTGPNLSSGNSYSYDVRSTPDQEVVLDQLGPATHNFTHYDVSELSIHFDVSPDSDQIELSVVFGSEEYPEFVASSFIDVFGVLLNGTNIALVDGRAMSLTNSAMRNIRGTELDGVLVSDGNPRIVLSGHVAPGSSNNVLTFIVADTSDAVIDTTVYLSELRATRLDLQEALRLGVTRAGPDEITLQVSGAPCGQIVIESSTNLFDWTAVRTNAPQNGSIQLPILSLPNSDTGFLRARRIPRY
jgi:hypothetical protein